MRKVIYIGTDTHRESRGIYCLTVDGQFREDVASRVLAAEMLSPTYEILSHDRKRLYAVSEAQPGIRGEVAAFCRTGKGLALINKALAPGAGLVHLTQNREETLLFAASYRDASVQMYELNQDGSIGRLLDEKIHEGRGADAVRQEKAHAHSVWLTPEERFLCVCDLGIDRLVVYRIDGEAGTLTEEKEAGLTFPAGAGPRHMAFDADGTCAYILTELSSEIYTATYDAEKGFEVTGRESMLPERRADCTGAAVRLSGDGRYLYASVRGADDIVIFRIGEDRIARRIGAVACGGMHPRDFVLADHDRYLLCANRDTDNIAVFSRDAVSGALYYQHEITGISMPVCVVAE